MKKIKQYLVAFIVILLIVSPLVFPAQSPKTKKQEEQKLSPEEEKIQVLITALELIQKRYIEDVDVEELIENTIKGILEELDPHSYFLTAEEYKDALERRTGKYEGIGVQIIKDKEKGDFIITNVFKNGPADKAGLQKNDKIIAVNGIKNENFQKLIDRVRGKQGTKVILTIERKSWDNAKDFKIERRSIKTTNIETGNIVWKTLDYNIGYIKIGNFRRGVKQETDEILKELEKQDIKGLILDLRNNWGGWLGEALGTVNNLIQKEKVIVFAKGRGDKITSVWKSTKRENDIQCPMVILVNEETTSASEIVAGALRDHGIAKIIGTRTFGKGLIQDTCHLPNGSVIMLTVERYYTPKAYAIQGRGITPDLIIEQPIQEEEPKEKPEIRREENLEGALKSEGIVEENPLDKYKNDFQLQKAIEVLKILMDLKENK